MKVKDKVLRIILILTASFLLTIGGGRLVSMSGVPVEAKAAAEISEDLPRSEETEGDRYGNKDSPDAVTGSAAELEGSVFGSSSMMITGLALIVGILIGMTAMRIKPKKKEE